MSNSFFQPTHALLREIGPEHSTGARRPNDISTLQGRAPSQMMAFTAALEAYTGQSFSKYQALHDFSVRDYRTFWRFFMQWSQGGLDFSGSLEPVCVGDDCERTRFFPQVQLNYADNLLNLSVAAAGAPALTACHADGRRLRLTRSELRVRVARLAQRLSALGLGEGDRVAGVMRSDAGAVVAALAVTALGASMSTAAPEMGVQAILDRFAPLAPRLLIAHCAPQAFDTGPSLSAKIAELAAALPSLEAILLLDDGALPHAAPQPVHTLDQLIEQGDAARFEWPRLPFNHPLFIMFSSGTTGKPKCIVHGAGGSLLEHLKEHRLHTDLRPGDRMYFHTNCAWMMWNWQLSALASGVEIVTYDGPISTVDRLWRLVADERVTVFGTSPAYLRMSEDAGLAPGQELDLGALRAILSTGAVLYDAQFDWVRDKVKPVPLQSISGGTDILGCFVLGHPDLPVVRGEAQCKSLGLGVQAWGRGEPASGVGELICTNPFPSRPLGFLDDTDGARFHAAYFSQHPGYWTHGDLIEFSPQGTARLHGRSDGVLNVRGINVAPGDIYRVLQDIPGIREAMVVEQRQRAAASAQQQAERVDERIVLLLVLQEGAVLDSVMVTRIRRELALRLSAAHVPDRIVAVRELPVTHSGKLSEAAARNAINGLRVDNAAALRNPGCLGAIRNHPGLGFEATALVTAGRSREQLEQQLQAQWEKRFGFAPIGLDDNFFELGGHSLLAAYLFADVRRLTGRALPLATMLAAPTIRRLAAMIEESVPPPLSRVLVPMRAGTGRPLFIVHGQRGSVMECRRLVEALRSPRPVYGLQAPGLDGEPAPQQQRVEDIAASYIEEVRSLQAAGPYAFAGYSFGGLVALEIAQQLRRAGESIEFLCLLDTYAQQDLPWTAWVEHHYRWAKRKLGELKVSQLPGYLAGKIAAAAAGAFGRLAPVPRRPADPQSVVTWTWQQMQTSMIAAMLTYRPQPYDGPIIHVRAAIDMGKYYDPVPLWRRVARGGLLVVDVPGDHFELIGSSAQLVAATLDRAMASG